MNVTLAGGAVSYDPDDDQLGRTSIELAAFDGEVGNGTLPIPDPAASLDVATGRQAMIEEGATLLSDGFIVDNDRLKGVDPAPRTSREYGFGLMDANALLDGFRISRTRPAETDYERVIAFADADLPSVDTTWVLDSSTVTMPAKKYRSDGGWTTELIPDLVSYTGKTLFLHDKADGSGRCLHYHGLTTGHTSGLTISDQIADSLGSTTSFFPQGPVRTRTSVDLRNDIKGIDQAGRVSFASDSTSISTHDADGLKHMAQVDFEATSQADLDQQTAAFLASQKDDLTTWQVTIGPLDEDALALIRAGDLITVTSAVMGLTASAQRISHMTLSPTIGENSRARTAWWNAALELGAPIRRRARVKARPQLPPTEPFVCIPPDYRVKSFSNSDHMALVFPAHTNSQSAVSDPGTANVDAMYIYAGAVYRIDYLVFHAPNSEDLTAALAPIGLSTILGTRVSTGYASLACRFGSPTDVPTGTIDYTAEFTGYVQAAMYEASCVGTDSYGSSLSAYITWLSGPDPRFEDLLPCSNGEPISGQAVHDAPFVGDGTTTSFTTQDARPYRPGTLQLIVNGLDWTNVPNVVTETDPTAGTYDVIYPFPVGATVLVRFVSP